MLNNIYQNWKITVNDLNLPNYKEFPDLELYMDQVIHELNKYIEPLLNKKITKTMINSYVKMGLVPHPIKKKYTAHHLALIMIVSILKTSFSLETIKYFMAEIEIDLQLKFDQFVKDFNHELHHLDQSHDQLDQNQIAIQAVLYKIILESQTKAPQ